KGRAYLPMPPGNKPIEVAVVQGLGAAFRTGQHTLQISVAKREAGAGTQGEMPGARMAAPIPQTQQLDLPGIGAVKVEARRSYVLFAIMTLLLIAGISIVSWA